ncbi:uncharacterized protein BX664DRAFT_334810 [Halteromyces radiatus]|uniref:uncharacterized protein n=1 Tax=Halteromyces radiatus TaxID=101107 RepID=UPI002221108C|nr:uncharacterized protein BX664DRAFT_334810 [Halteromyces radiatus]KAI8086057.1 hypothetical protein BX664DRAFT_334810 [Halteromyces radiatus]
MSAIPIVAPSDDPPSSTPTSPSTTTTKNVPPKPASKSSSANAKRLCRNVIIHGFCKFEDKGCEFNHDTNNNKSVAQPSPESKTSVRLVSPARANTLPTSIVSSVSADSVNAPVFVPKSVSDNPVPLRTGTPMSAPVQPETPIESSESDGHVQDPNIMPTLTHSFSQFDLSPAIPPNFQPPMPQDMMNMMPPGAVDPYFYMNHGYPRQPLQYHLYTSALPHVANLHPHQRSIQSFFIPDHLREQLTRRNEAILATPPAGHDNLPQEVHVYHSLCPLEDQPGQFFGHPSWVYKATCSVDGRTYALVRIEGFRLVNEMAMSVIENWRHTRHCNIISIREAFTSRAFGDSSLIFTYDYHPCSVTLYNAHFTPQAQAALLAQLQAMGSNNALMPETTLWSYITQISSALKAVHGSGLASRNIEPNKILLTGKNRLRISCSGIMDVLQYDGGQNVARYQQEDLLSFGKLVIALACNSLQSVHNLPQSFEFISRYYSPDLKNLVLFLLSKPLPTKTIDEAITLIGPRILHEINCSQYYSDALESELSKELENGRLVRLLSKLGFINERPEFDMDPRWSETGDRYIIKLFRDYVFHQVDENGVPVVDMAHVLTCLNKLDAGIDEKIMLMSRDEQSCLIVSYKEIKNCISAAFNDISSGRK